MAELGELKYVSERYGTVHAYMEYSNRREQYELAVYLKTPIHLYDFVFYRPAGKHTTRFHDGRVEEGYHEEEIGSQVYTNPKNMRFDFEVDGPSLTAELVDGKLDEEFRDAIENYDGVIIFDKIIGVK